MREVKNQYLHMDILDAFKKCQNKIDVLACLCSVQCIVEDAYELARLAEQEWLIQQKDLVDRLQKQESYINRLDEDFRNSTFLLLEEAMKQSSSIIRWINDNCYKEDRDDAFYYLYEKVIDFSLPECFGYNICDLGVCEKDAQRFPYNGSRLMILSIRTGGVFFAPYWMQYCEEHQIEYVCHSVRPLRNNGDCIYQDKYLSDEKKKECQIIILDDQIGTGQTIKTLIEYLIENEFHSENIYVNSPGKLYQVRHRNLELMYQGIPLTKDNQKLWACDYADFKKSILEIVSADSKDDYDVELEESNKKNYYHTKRWIWWKEQYQKDNFCHINPKKTRFYVKRKIDNSVIYNIRFIGESIYGKICVENLVRMGILCYPFRFVDGFLIARRIPNLVNLRDCYRMCNKLQREMLNQQVVSYFLNQLTLLGLQEVNMMKKCSLQKQVSDAYCELQLITDMKPDHEWLTEKIKKEIVEYGYQRVIVKTSLPYANEYWHWKVALKTDEVKVFLFHADYTWGTFLGIDLILAIFFVENRIKVEDIIDICHYIGIGLGTDNLSLTVLSCMDYAIYLKLKTWLKDKDSLHREDGVYFENELKSVLSYIELIRDEMKPE